MRSPAPLIQAVNELGIRNISALARRTKMPIETARYWMERRLPRLGIHLQVAVDYQRLGLWWSLADLAIPPGRASAAPQLLQRLAERAYLTFHAQDVAYHRYTTFWAVPVRQEAAVREFLNGMVRQGLLERFELHRLRWGRQVATDPTFFDVRRRRWVPDWKALVQRPIKLAESPARGMPPAEPDVDPTDLLLISELQRNPGQHLSEISRTRRVDRRTLQYHYQQHVRRNMIRYLMQWRPAPSRGERALLLDCRCTTRPAKRLRQVRLAFNRLPFLQFEAGDDGGFYSATLVVPTSELVNTLKFLRTQLGDLAGIHTYRLLEVDTATSYPIPHQHFARREGWTFELRKALQNIPVAPIISGRRKRRTGRA